MQHPLLEQIVAIAEQAGAAILALYNQPQQVTIKADDSPVTAADLAAHQLIAQGLSQLDEHYPLLSEENADIAWAERSGWPRYWLVDPLDGTKEYIKRNGEFTVNIALIEHGKPVLAVVHAPVLATTYAAAQDVGAWKSSQGNSATRHWQPLAVSQAQSPVRIVGSRSHPSLELANYVQRFSAVSHVAVGSSLKFCLVAEGLADCYPRLGPTSEWDTAAGHCIAEQAGATVRQLDGAELRYNQKSALLNPHFVVQTPWLG